MDHRGALQFFSHGTDRAHGILVIIHHISIIYSTCYSGVTTQSEPQNIRMNMKHMVTLFPKCRHKVSSRKTVWLLRGVSPFTIEGKYGRFTVCVKK